MKALDLFCGGGGAAIGMLQAGFDEVVGIDIAPHPNYPGTFIQADIHHMPVDVLDFDFVWASPPCQKFSVARKSTSRQPATNLIPVSRQAFKAHPFTVIENVPRAPIRPDVILSGPSVGLQKIIRVRHFETSFFMMYPTCQKLSDPKKRMNAEVYTITKSLRAKNHFYPRKRKGLRGELGIDEAKDAMGIPLKYRMTKEEIGESVPPPYSKFIADYVIEHYLMKGINVS